MKHTLERKINKVQTKNTNYASSIESDHAHDNDHGSDHDMEEHEHVEGIAEDTCMTPQEEEAMRDDTGS